MVDAFQAQSIVSGQKGSTFHLGGCMDAVIAVNGKGGGEIMLTMSVDRKEGNLVRLKQRIREAGCGFEGPVPPEKCDGEKSVTYVSQRLDTLLPERTIARNDLERVCGERGCRMLDLPEALTLVVEAVESRRGHIGYLILLQDGLVLELSRNRVLVFHAKPEAQLNPLHNTEIVFAKEERQEVLRPRRKKIHDGTLGAWRAD